MNLWFKLCEIASAKRMNKYGENEKIVVCLARTWKLLLSISHVDSVQCTVYTHRVQHTHTTNDCCFNNADIVNMIDLATENRNIWSYKRPNACRFRSDCRLAVARRCSQTYSFLLPFTIDRDAMNSESLAIVANKQQKKMNRRRRRPVSIILIGFWLFERERTCVCTRASYAREFPLSALSTWYKV